MAVNWNPRCYSIGYVAGAITPLSSEFADEVSLMNNSWVVTPWNEGALTDSSTDTSRYHLLQIYMLWCPLSHLTIFRTIAGVYADLSCV